MHIHHTHKTRMILQSNDAGAFREKCTVCGTTNATVLALPCFDTTTVLAYTIAQNIARARLNPLDPPPMPTMRAVLRDGKLVITDYEIKSRATAAPSWPDCGCPDGVISETCPCHRRKPAERASEPPRAAETPRRRPVMPGWYGRIIVATYFTDGRYQIKFADEEPMTADDLREVAHLFNQMAESLEP